MDPVTVSLNTSFAAQSVLSADMFGANYVYNYERIGDLPWERFDEIIDQLGSQQLRFPGGNAIETSFNYMNPDSPVDLAGRPVMGMSDFISFAGTRGIDPIILLPNMPFAPNKTHQLVIWDDATGGWVLDPTAVAGAKAVIDNIVTTAIAAAKAAGIGIAAFEIGNEFPGITYIGDNGQTYHMSGTQYGIIANEMAQWVQEAIEAHDAPGDPKILVQVWGDYNHEGVGPTELDVSNARVLAEFDADGLDAIDGTANHIYFRDGKTPLDGSESHSYDSLNHRIADMAAMSEQWETAAGKDLELHITEWNVQKTTIHEPTDAQWSANSTWTVSAEWKEAAHYGLKQIAPMLEMVSAFNMEGVDTAQVWSVMYNAASLGLQDNGGSLSAPGAAFALMADVLPGTRYQEMDADTAEATVHTFVGNGSTHVFLSSRCDMERVFEVDLTELSPESSHVSVTYIGVDTSASDGRFMQDGRTYVTGSDTWLEADLEGTVTPTSGVLVDGMLALTLGAYEVALISFSEGPWNMITGSDATEQLHGTDADDRIRGLEGKDYIRGEDGTDWLEGGKDDDAIYGGSGSDLIEGGAGNDWLQGGAGNYSDEIKGGAGDDTALGGAGKDHIYGGKGHDLIQGDRGNDILRGQNGKDEIYGGSGNDWLHGDGARDYLDGGGGNDTLRGGAGADRLVGGSGADRFLFRLDEWSGHDRILDFAPGVDVVSFKGTEEDGLDRLTFTEIDNYLEVSWDLGTVKLLNTSLSDIDVETDIEFL